MAKKIGEVINLFYKKNNLFKKDKNLSLIDQWKSVVGPHIANKTIKINITNKILIVYVAHPIIKSELNYAKSRILNELKEKYNYLDFSEIKII